MKVCTYRNGLVKVSFVSRLLITHLQEAASPVRLVLFPQKVSIIHNTINEFFRFISDREGGVREKQRNSLSALSVEKAQQQCPSPLWRSRITRATGPRSSLFFLFFFPHLMQGYRCGWEIISVDGWMCVCAGQIGCPLQFWASGKSKIIFYNAHTFSLFREEKYQSCHVRREAFFRSDC